MCAQANGDRVKMATSNKADAEASGYQVNAVAKMRMPAHSTCAERTMPVSCRDAVQSEAVCMEDSRAGLTAQ
jgi:hypothetical protein